MLFPSIGEKMTPFSGVLPTDASLAAIVRGGNPQPASNRAAWNPSYTLECTTYTHLELERLVINFAQTRLGTLRYIFAITDSGPESGAGGRETGRAPA
jgi:hypothetical protein